MSALPALVQGLHHITATVDRALDDLHFYTKLLGLRLVKKTVNFDNEGVYHFYYGDRKGSPSSVFTTFPYGGHNVRKGKIGAGQVVETTFSIPVGSLAYWNKRLKNAGLSPKEASFFDRPLVRFNDPSGLRLALIEEEEISGIDPWYASGIDANGVLHGINHARLLVNELEPTLGFLHQLGYKVRHYQGGEYWLEAGNGGAGNRLALEVNARAPKGINGIGTVHHIAHRVASKEDSYAIKDWLESNFRIQVTELKDRKYFKSIYFRIPGGVMFEIATVGPGFTDDEDVDALGSGLKLPYWQEKHRERIEKALPELN
jgi:glyoxalase family protein